MKRFLFSSLLIHFCFFSLAAVLPMDLKREVLSALEAELVYDPITSKKPVRPSVTREKRYVLLTTSPATTDSSLLAERSDPSSLHQSTPWEEMLDPGPGQGRNMESERDDLKKLQHLDWMSSGGSDKNPPSETLSAPLLAKKERLVAEEAKAAEPEPSPGKPMEAGPLLASLGSVPVWIVLQDGSDRSSHSPPPLPVETKQMAQPSPAPPPLEEVFFVHPKYGDNPKPVYPSEARKKGFQGEVILRVEVLASGLVGRVEVKKSSGHELLDRSALSAVKQWRFVPAMLGGNAISSWVNIPIRFQLR